MVFEVVAELISSIMLVDETSITMDSSLTDDLGIDSVDGVDLLMALEERFDLEIADEDADGFKTVSDVVSYIESRRD